VSQVEWESAKKFFLVGVYGVCCAKSMALSNQAIHHAFASLPGPCRSFDRRCCQCDDDHTGTQRFGPAGQFQRRPREQHQVLSKAPLTRLWATLLCQQRPVVAFSELPVKTFVGLESSKKSFATVATSAPMSASIVPNRVVVENVN
jgi:hypothetical protein